MIQQTSERQDEQRERGQRQDDEVRGGQHQEWEWWWVDPSSVPPLDDVEDLPEDDAFADDEPLHDEALYGEPVGDASWYGGGEGGGLGETWPWFAGMAPGGRAAAGVAWGHARLGRLPDAHVLDAVAAARRIASWAQGVEMMAAVELFERPAVREDGSPLPAALAAVHRDSVLEEIAAKLRVTSGTAAYLVAQGGTLKRRFPRVLALLLLGRLDIAKVNAFVNGCAFVCDEHAALVEDRLIDGAENLTSGQLRSKIAKLV
ncbi:DUF222 domain-containing protein, partial [Planotetraspora sp. GP83]|uniref:DUF222 domain-containing protein n=1 Tax=Planotetraspora sp. GP83 TaxID=3156264 RepID=UPI0035141180